MIDDAQVDHIAKLARLKISDEERESLKRDLANILSYFETLNELDTSGVEPMKHVIETENVLREDEPTGSIPREQALQNAPATDGEYFIVPRVLER